ncbi:hypothetical protein IFM89_032253 [Coptis chinensis]|uniref:Pentatricopeptide repeat-containing protein n=1 Tax=Coptis chinensis TaxID=261450 RepID=A0A835M7M8_9MAGN|nr:hypothetical protein IFM89_032253 [Coptis chinensis]
MFCTQVCSICIDIHYSLETLILNIYQVVWDISWNSSIAVHNVKLPILHTSEYKIAKRVEHVEGKCVVSKNLLAACRNRGDVEVAKRAADSVWKLDPSDSASHVLLGNILASTGNWGEVARVRRLMRSRGVRKVPGQSWIEVKNRVNVFSVEDRKHTNMDQIYSVLEGLYLEMEANCSLEEKVASAKALHK